MTTDRSTLASGINALAALVHAIRPEWDPPGIVATARRIVDDAHLDLREIAIAMLRATADPTNDTPAAITHLDNRAWDTDGYPPCKTHPRAPRRTSGECAGCYADRQAAAVYVIPRRQGVPPTPDVRAQLQAAIRPSRSDTAGASEATPDTATSTRSTGVAS